MQDRIAKSKDGGSAEDEDTASNKAQPESRSMTSMEHLKQMDSFGEFASKRYETVLSDLPDDEDHSGQLRDINLGSAGIT